ncbi:hypothetical protein Taro_007426 [Colocasia esculenta]|uniref:Uncharacterized protein n=1 Tax=Colocasia esculenta TaxID=4460 RepID=A0A843TRA2_COLES|nr:hypothetical protein [Colocasia esculenta]
MRVRTAVEDKTSVDAPDRLTSGSAEFPLSLFVSCVVVTMSSCTEFQTVLYFRAALVVALLLHFRFVGETSQQRQGAHWVEEMGR